MHIVISQYTKQPYLSTIEQPNFISVPNDNFKYLAMYLPRKFEVSVPSFYTLN